VLRLAVDNNIQAVDMVANVDTNGLDICLYGHMALSVAVAHGHLEMVKHLIEKGANPHERRSLGLPLHHGYSTVWVAVAKGDLRCSNSCSNSRAYGPTSGT
jgi:ankyrin repeat protein